MLSMTELLIYNVPIDNLDLSQKLENSAAAVFVDMQKKNSNIKVDPTLVFQNLELKDYNY